LEPHPRKMAPTSFLKEGIGLKRLKIKVLKTFAKVIRSPKELKNPTFKKKINNPQ